MTLISNNIASDKERHFLGYFLLLSKFELILEKQVVLGKLYETICIKETVSVSVGLFDRSYIFSTLDREQPSQIEDKLSI